MAARSPRGEKTACPTPASAVQARSSTPRASPSDSSNPLTRRVRLPSAVNRIEPPPVKDVRDRRRPVAASRRSCVVPAAPPVKRHASRLPSGEKAAEHRDRNPAAAGGAAGLGGGGGGITGGRLAGTAGAFANRAIGAGWGSGFTPPR